MVEVCTWDWQLVRLAGNAGQERFKTCKWARDGGWWQGGQASTSSKGSKRRR